MKVYIVGFFALVIVGGLTLPVCARVVEKSVAGFTSMTPEQQEQIKREITRENKLIIGRDKMKIKDDIIQMPCWLCELSGQRCPGC